jgi:hypothetical protein
MDEKIFVAIRSIGERTEEACLRIVQSQLGSASQVKLIKNKKFSEAHIESIESALRSDSQWALFLDADVLLRKDAIREMLREAQKISFPFYQFNFRILDRGFSGETYGVHFYSMEHFETAVKIKRIILEAQRPEHQLCFEMAKRYGIPSISSDITVGLHGYQQYYADLYRTTFVRAVKYRNHHNYMFRLYEEGYFKQNSGDMDHQFMFWGAIDGAIFSHDNEKVPIDYQIFKGKTDRIFVLLDTGEKGAYNHEQDYVEQTIENYHPDQLYNANREWICPSRFYTNMVPDKSLRNKTRILIMNILRRLKNSVLALIRA